MRWLLRLTYDDQIQQGLAALPLLQLSLDVDGVPRLPGAARCGNRGGVVRSRPFGRGLGPFGRGLGGRGRGGARRSGTYPVLPRAEEGTPPILIALKTGVLSCRRHESAAGTWERRSPWSASCLRRSCGRLWGPLHTPLCCELRTETIMTHFPD